MKNESSFAALNEKPPKPPAAETIPNVESFEVPADVTDKQEGELTQEGVESFVSGLERNAIAQESEALEGLQIGQDELGTTSGTGEKEILIQENLNEEASEVRAGMEALGRTFREKIGALKARMAAGALAGTFAMGAMAEGPESPSVPDSYERVVVGKVVSNEIPTPDIPRVLQMDTRLHSVAPSEAKETDVDLMKDNPNLFEGFMRGSNEAVDDPAVLKLTRELRDPEGTLREGEIVMEGYQGFTAEQLRSLRRISELADREHTVVFSRDGNEKFGTVSRERHGKMSAAIDADAILESAKGGRETVEVHTHPVQNTNIFVPSLQDLISGAQLGKYIEEEGCDPDKLRSVAVAPNGLWEYSLDTHSATAKQLLAINEWRNSMAEACNAEIKRMNLTAEAERELRDRFETMDAVDIVSLARDSSDPAMKAVGRVILDQVQMKSGELVDSPAGKLMQEYSEKISSFMSGETEEKRKEFIQWAKEHDINLKFTPFPKQLMDGEVEKEPLQR